MHWLDSIILALLGLSAALGFWSGLLCQVARLAGLTLGLAAAVVYNEPVAQWLQEQVLRQGDPRLCGALAYGVVFVGVFLATILLSRTLYQAVHGSELELVDRLLGAGLAVAKCGLFLGMVSLGLARAEQPAARALLAQSQLSPLLGRSMATLVECLPDGAKERVQQGLRRVGAGDAETTGQMLGPGFMHRMHQGTSHGTVR